MDSDQEHDLNFRQVLVILRQRAIWIGAITAVASLAVFLLSSRTPDSFRATSQVRVNNPNSEKLFQGGTGQVPIDPRRQVETETQVLQSNDIRLAVNERMGDRAAEIEAVTVSNPENTDLLNIAVTSTSPEVARDAANAYTEVYVERRKNRASGELVRLAEGLRSEADALDRQIQELDQALSGRSGSNDDQLRARRSQLINQQGTVNNLAFQLGAQAPLISGASEVVERAVTPRAPVAPKPVRDAALAGVLALLAAGGGALLLDRLDDRITSPEDLERTLPTTPLLSSVPIYTPKGKRGAAKIPHGPRVLVPLNSVHAEVYRTLRSNVLFSNLGRSKRVLMVTSSSGSEGKSTVTANLAVSLAESGQRVVLVSADLRRPVLSTIFGVPETDRGLTNVLHNESTLAECLVPVTLDSGHRLYVLPAGRVPHNPAELLGSGMMGAVLRGLRDADVDLVLIDCPPVLPVSDPLAVAQHVDSVIMLAVVGQTRAHHLSEAFQRLQKVGADVMGVVLNGVPTARGRYPYYYYRRYGKYGGYGDAPFAEGTEQVLPDEEAQAVPASRSMSSAGL